MSNGIFGSVIPADVNIERDVEILYNYKPNRGDDGDDDGFKSLNPSVCLSKSVLGSDNIEGLYNLRLPLKDFNKKGIYTIYIKPKEYELTVNSVGFLAGYPDVKGIILNKSEELSTDIVGYRLEFEFNHQMYTKIIRSCNYCEAVVGGGFNLTTNTQKSIIFCTITPSTTSSSSNISGIWPDSGESVKLINTKFAPKMIEIEMTEHDADTISYMLEGNQINDRDKGLITTLNDNNEIYHQSEYYTLKDTLGKPLYTVKKKINKPTQEDINDILNQ